jgi:hypothetical protein
VAHEKLHDLTERLHLTRDPNRDEPKADDGTAKKETSVAAKK